MPSNQAGVARKTGTPRRVAFDSIGRTVFTMTVVSSSATSRVLATLHSALAAWREGDPAPLEEWSARELDEAGAPVESPLREWAQALEALAETARGRSGGRETDGKVLDFVRMLLRFSRPDGATATASDAPGRPREFWRKVRTAFPADDVDRALDWWFPRRGVADAATPPPPASWSASDRVLGVLRADWTKRGDVLAFDQRTGADALLELFGRGVSWLGPRWSTSGEEIEAPARVTALESGPNAGAAEWTFRAGGREITRLAVTLHGRRLALLADLHAEGDVVAALDVPAGLSYQPLAAPGAATLKPDKSGKSAQAVLIAPGEARFDAASRRLQLRSTAGGRWLPLLVSWDHARHRRPLTWVELTVAEDGRRCPRDVAWAARASWGRSETFVFYRSLGRSARRSFLGCSTTARLLVGRFTPEGDVEPIVTLE